MGSAVDIALLGAVGNTTLADTEYPMRAAMSTAAHHVYVTGAVRTVLPLVSVALMPPLAGSRCRGVNPAIGGYGSHRQPLEQPFGAAAGGAPVTIICAMLDR